LAQSSILRIAACFALSTSLLGAWPKVKTVNGTEIYTFQNGRVCTKPQIYTVLKRTIAGDITGPVGLDSKASKLQVDQLLKGKLDMSKELKDVAPINTSMNWTASRLFETCVANASGSLSDADRTRIDNQVRELDIKRQEEENKPKEPVKPQPKAQKWVPTNELIVRTFPTTNRHCSRNCQGQPTQGTDTFPPIAAVDGYRFTTGSMTCEGANNICAFTSEYSVRIEGGGKQAVGSMKTWGPSVTARITLKQEKLQFD
jgi:hypothetical protein